LKRLAAALAATALASVPTLAQDASNWPGQPITLVVPFPPGNNTDNVARIVADAMSTSLGQPVIIDNRPGASGAVGMNVVATAEPDGYTIGIGTTTTLTVSASLNANLPYDAETAFAAIGRIGQVPYVLAVNPELPAEDLGGLVDLAKEEPGALSYGSTGEASLANLATVILSNSTGIELTHVPYNAAGEASLDVISGRISMQFSTLGATIPFIEDGQLRAIAVSSPDRVPELPDVPTIAESGIAGLEGFDVTLWFALVAPAGTPDEVLDRLNEELNAALEAQPVIEALANQGVTPQTATRDEVGALIASEIETWRSVAEAAGLSAQ
jgi:tripartite-type tricarboxylate transporter receptor subunit TctC